MIIEQIDYSEKKLFSPILYKIDNLCQSFSNSNEDIKDILLNFTVPKDRKVKLYYQSNEIKETIFEYNDYIIQQFMILNPIEDSNIIVQTSDGKNKTFKIEFSKNYISNFTENNSLYFEDDDIQFDKKININSNEINQYLKQGRFYFKIKNKQYNCTYNENTTSISCSINKTLESEHDLIFEDKCLKTYILNFKIKLKIYGMGLIQPGPQIKVNGNIFLLSSIFYRPLCIQVSNGFTISKIYLNDEVISIHRFTNYIAFCYNLNKTGDYQLKYEETNDFILAIHKDNERFINICNIYVRNNFNEILPVFNWNNYCTFNLGKLINFSISVNHDLDIKNYLYIKFPKDNHSKKYSSLIQNINSNIYTYNLSQIIGSNYNMNNKQFKIEVLDYDNNILYESILIYSDFQIKPFYFLKDNYIYLNNITCDPGDITIKNINNDTINEKCIFMENSLKCKIIKESVGRVYIYSDNDLISSIYISKEFNESNFILNKIDLSVGWNKITLKSNNYYLPLIQEIQIYDNDYKYIQNIILKNLLYIDEYNSYEFGFMVYPNTQNMFIKFYDDKEQFKEISLNIKNLNIDFKINENFFILGNEEQVVEIKIEWDEINIINNIYIKENGIFNKDKPFRKDDNNEFSYTLENKGIFTFGYSINTNEGNYNLYIFDIPDIKINVGLHIFDFLVFIPPNPFILIDLAEEELKLDIIPNIRFIGYNIDIKLYLYKENNLNNKLEYKHNKATSIYQLSNDDIKKLETNINYYFIICENNTRKILYQQKIIFSNIKVKPFYYTCDYIVISNINDKINYLTISNEGNEIYELENQKLYPELHILYISIPQHLPYGLYKMQIDRDNFASFYLSKRIFNADFLISKMTEKNKIIITSPNFYLPNIYSIEVISNLNETFTYYSNSFSFSDNNDRIIVSLNIKEGNNYSITKITEKCQFSNEEKCIKIVNKQIESNSFESFNVTKYYPIKKEVDNISSVFFIQLVIKVLVPTNMNSYYFSINKNMFYVCYIEYNNLICEYPFEQKEGKALISYNEDDKNFKTIYYFIYSFIQNNQCQCNSNLEDIELYLAIDNSVKVYFDDIELKNMSSKYNISKSYLSKGEHYIYLKDETGEKEKISALKIEIYEEKIINDITGILYEGLDSQNIQLIFLNDFSSIKNTFLLLNNSNNQIYSSNCKLSSINSKEVNCEFDLSSASMGIYNLYYLNDCNEYILIKEIKGNPNFALIKVQPNNLNIEELEYLTEIELIFSQNFNKTKFPEKIILKNKRIKTNFIEFNDFSINLNSIILYYPKKYKLNGEYLIEVKLIDGTVFSNLNTIKFSKSISLYDKKLTLIKKPNEIISNIPIIFTSELTKNSIQKVVYQDSLNLHFYNFNNDSKILIVSTSSLNLDYGEHIFNIYTLTDSFKYKLNLINSTTKIFPNHFINLHSFDDDAYLIFSVSELISCIYYKTDLMENIKFLYPLWPNSNIYFYKTKELDESFEIYYQEKKSKEIKKYDNIIYIINDIFNYITDNSNSCITNECGFDNLIRKTLKYYCFEQIQISLNKMENLITFNFTSTLGKLYDFELSYQIQNIMFHMMNIFLV